jgi:hypothetical protein
VESVVVVKWGDQLLESARMVLVDWAAQLQGEQADGLADEGLMG